MNLSVDQPTLELPAPAAAQSPPVDTARLEAMAQALVTPLLELIEQISAYRRDDWSDSLQLALERLRQLQSQRSPLAEALERTGGCYAAETVQRLLNVERQALYNRRRDRKILALRRGDDSFVYPAIQFVFDLDDPARPIRLHDRLRDILAAGAMLTPTELFGWLATPQPSLEGHTGWGLMHEGRADEVIALLHLLRGGETGVDDLPLEVDSSHSADVLGNTHTAMPTVERPMYAAVLRQEAPAGARRSIGTRTGKSSLKEGRFVTPKNANPTIVREGREAATPVTKKDIHKVAKTSAKVAGRKSLRGRKGS